MDIQVYFFRWQVPDLKEYLQHRGIACHLYRKHELVKLCELAQELDLEKITSTNELSQVNRRTITENCVTQVVCEIGQVPIWSSDLKLLPNIEQCDIRVITKLPNSEQSYKGKVKTHNYINRQNQSTTGKL
jgi:hypothetical protein